jgi:hypothetical protein
MFSRDEVRVKSWEGGTKELSTEIKVKKNDFDDYEVFNGRVDLTLPMREFRVSCNAWSAIEASADSQATMALADQLSIKLVVAFSEPGQPLTLTSDPEEADKSTIPDIFCAIATTTCDQFLTVKTPSDPQPTTSGHRTGSSTSFLDRHGSRGRDVSVGANGASQDGGEDRNVRRRLNSEQPVRRGRLSMSSQPSRVNNSVPTTTSTRHASNGEEPLFLQTDSQYQAHDSNEHEYDPGTTGLSASQQPRLSQAEVEAISGLGDMDDVMDAMDDLQHEEEVEEMRASQQVEPEERPSQLRAREPLGEIELDPLREPAISDRPADGDSTSTRVGDPAPAKDDPLEEADITVDVGNDTEQAEFEVRPPDQEPAQVEQQADQAEQAEQVDYAGEQSLDDQVDELEEDEEEPIPATQHIMDDDDEAEIPRVSLTPQRRVPWT